MHKCVIDLCVFAHWGQSFITLLFTLFFALYLHFSYHPFSAPPVSGNARPATFCSAAVDFDSLGAVLNAHLLFHCFSQVPFGAIWVPPGFDFGPPGAQKTAPNDSFCMSPRIRLRGGSQSCKQGSAGLDKHCPR